MSDQPNYWELGRWGRVPVALHWTVLIMFVWFFVIFMDLFTTLVASAAFFVLLVIHELGHVAVLRAKKIPVERVTLYGLHGRTDHAYASHGVEIAIAWGGVGAQLVTLVLALVATYTVNLSAVPLLARIVGIVLMVFIRFNIFLMIVALLPIGPFDGKAAWAAIPYLRASLRRRKRVARERKMFPETALSPERRRELEVSSAKEAADLLGKFAKKGGERKEDA